MKLVLAIVQDEDSVNVMDELNINGFMVTKMCSSGGFLRVGNTTLLIGVEEDGVARVLEIIESTCKSHRKVINPGVSPAATGEYLSYPVEITVGGATVFVVDVDQFHKF
ncbi:MAG: cyclic-di-AMP receptor [Clostridia bacterium]|nr:cyclic-di-AMP receptor [Clostridia bacterium]